MSKHTPGPWNWDGDVTDYDHDQEAPWLISSTDSILTGEIEATNRADVVLIAAAPDLLEALDATTRYLRETLALPSNAPILPVIRSLVISGESAINKARGRT